MLEVKNIRYTYEKEKRMSVDNISLTIQPDERVGLYAPSGYGKTTLLRLLGGYLTPEAGSILVDGSPLPKRGYCPVQMIWQHPEQAINPRLRLKETLKEGNQIEESLIKRLGIEEDWKNRYPTELSGGELQRFCIARALGAHTKYLLADEMETMLDVITQSQIWQCVIEETKKRQIGMLVVSHNLPLLEKVTTRIIKMEDIAGIKTEN